ncbi:MAG: DKNYY domain-containing protein [Bacteroidota bacterium]
MSRLLYLFLIIILIQSCKPGIRVDSKNSDSYYYQPVSFLIIYSPRGNWFELDYRVLSTLPWNFKVLSEDIGKNNNAVFYKYHKQTNFDIESFTVNNNVIKDKNFVYTISEQNSFIPILGADIKTFIYLKPNSVNQLVWAKDKHRFYFHDKPVKVDFGTFNFINENYFYDKDSIYTTYNTTIISIDVFQGKLIPINNQYSKNNSKIFFFGYDKYRKLPINNFDAISVIADNILKIGDKIIFNGEIFPINDVDAKTFTVLHKNSNYYKDKKHIYYNDTILSNDIKRFTLLFDDNKEYPAYSKDSRHVYWGGKIVDSINVDNFHYDNKLHKWTDGNSIVDADIATKKSTNR